jgi:hypothetical protein
MDDQEILNDLLVHAQHMIIGVTLDDGTPWQIPVEIKQREGNTFEWESKLDTLHSLAIAERPHIALLIFKTEPNVGFYAKATAEELYRRDDGFGRYRATVTESWINEQFHKRPMSLS